RGVRAMGWRHRGPRRARCSRGGVEALLPVLPFSGRTLEHRVENPSCWSSRRFDSIAETTEFPDHSNGATSSRVCVHRRTAFLVSYTPVQNDPDQSAQPMGDGPDGLIVSQPRNQSAVDDLENAALHLNRSVGRLIENASHVTIALRRTVTLRNPG